MAQAQKTRKQPEKLAAILDCQGPACRMLAMIDQLSNVCALPMDKLSVDSLRLYLKLFNMFYNFSPSRWSPRFKGLYDSPDIKWWPRNSHPRDPQGGKAAKKKNSGDDARPDMQRPELQTIVVAFVDAFNEGTREAARNGFEELQNYLLKDPGARHLFRSDECVLNDKHDGTSNSEDTMADNVLQTTTLTLGTNIQCGPRYQPTPVTVHDGADRNLHVQTHLKQETTDGDILPATFDPCNDEDSVMPLLSSYSDLVTLNTRDIEYKSNEYSKTYDKAEGDLQEIINTALDMEEDYRQIPYRLPVGNTVSSIAENHDVQEVQPKLVNSSTFQGHTTVHKDTEELSRPISARPGIGDAAGPSAMHTGPTVSDCLSAVRKEGIISEDIKSLASINQVKDDQSSKRQQYFNSAESILDFFETTRKDVEKKIVSQTNATPMLLGLLREENESAKFKNDLDQFSVNRPVPTQEAVLIPTTVLGTAKKNSPPRYQADRIKLKKRQQEYTDHDSMDKKAKQWVCDGSAESTQKMES